MYAFLRELGTNIYSFKEVENMFDNKVYLFGQIDTTSLIHSKDKQGKSVLKFKLNTIFNALEQRQLDSAMSPTQGLDYISPFDLIAAINQHKSIFSSVLKNTLLNMENDSKDNFVSNMDGWEFKHTCYQASKVFCDYLMADALGGVGHNNECFKTANLHELFGEQVFKKMEAHNFASTAAFRSVKESSAIRSEAKDFEQRYKQAKLWALQHLSKDSDVRTGLLLKELLNNQELFQSFLESFLAQLQEKLLEEAKSATSQESTQILEVANEQGQFVSVGYKGATLHLSQSVNNIDNYDIPVLQNLDREDLYLAHHDFVNGMQQQIKRDRALCRKEKTQFFAYKVLVGQCANSELSFLYRLLKINGHIPVMVVGQLIPEYQMISNSSSEVMIKATKFAFYKEKGSSSLPVAV